MADLSAPPGEDLPSRSAEELGRRDHRLVEAVARATDAKTVCELVAQVLFRRGDCMPSVYLERRGALRCMAQRGLWQVLDGMSARAGITGRAWDEARTIVVDDVRRHPGYREAIPGVISEICVPIAVDGRPAGALNVESLSLLPADTRATVEWCAELVGRRIGELGLADAGTAWQRAATASVAISRLPRGTDSAPAALAAIQETAGMDSGCVVLTAGAPPLVVAASGPLAPALAALSEWDLVGLAGLVTDVRSCYSAGADTNHGFGIGASLRSSGARAVVVLSLVAGTQTVGFVVLAHSGQLPVTADDVEALEVLADQLGAAFIAVPPTAPPA